MDFKMFIFPAVLLLQKQFVDLTEQSNIDIVRTALISIIAAALGCYLMVYMQVSGKKAGAETKIWIPPKPEPTMPFSAPPAAPTPDKYVESTYYDHEMALIKEGLSAMAMSCGIALFMSFKFNIHVSSLAQIFSLPYTLYESPLVRKYVLGMKADYKELTEAPVSEGTQTIGDASTDPRVEEISEEEFKTVKAKENKNKKSSKKESEKVATPEPSDADDID
jgi:hypothetical protein